MPIKLPIIRLDLPIRCIYFIFCKPLFLSLFTTTHIAQPRGLSRLLAFFVP